MSEEVKNTDYVLEVENLHTCFHTESGDVNAVNGLSMTCMNMNFMEYAQIY